MSCCSQERCGSQLRALLRFDLWNVRALKSTGMRLGHSVRSCPHETFPEREPLIVSRQVRFDATKRLFGLDTKLHKLIVIPLKFCLEGVVSHSSLLLESIAPRGGFRVTRINPREQPLLHAINPLLDSIAPRGGLHVNRIDPSSQLLVKCVDSAAQLSRTSENRSENGKYTGDERDARENSFKTHLDHPSILTSTADTTHLFR